MHPLHTLRKLRLFRAIARRFDPVIARQLPLLARPIYLRLLSHGSIICNSSAREASIRETFAATLGALPNEHKTAFWDLGANIGWFSWLCATLRPDFEIVSFEPDPNNLHLLQRTSRRWNLPQHTIVPGAVSDRSGRAIFFLDDITGATGSLEERDFFNLRHYKARPRKIEIDTISLDDFMAKRATPPAVIKIDVEGAELRVLQGAANLLREHRPILFFEAFSRGDKILALLHDHGYFVYDSNRQQSVMKETTNFVALVPARWPAVIAALGARGYPVDPPNG